jgi:hypothetical protein
LPPYSLENQDVRDAWKPASKVRRLFFWGTDVGSLKFAENWINIFDEADPVADPLKPPAQWRLHEDWRGCRRQKSI